jgi:hypothetical protein
MMEVLSGPAAGASAASRRFWFLRSGCALILGAACCGAVAVRAALARECLRHFDRFPTLGEVTLSGV